MPKALFLDKLFFYHVVPVKPYLLVNLPVNRWSGKIKKLKALSSRYRILLFEEVTMSDTAVLYNKEGLLLG